MSQPSKSLRLRLIGSKCRKEFKADKATQVCKLASDDVNSAWQVCTASKLTLLEVFQAFSRVALFGCLDHFKDLVLEMLVSGSF